MPNRPPPPPLHQQTAHLNAGLVTQVYKQQTVGPHQRLSLKDNRSRSPPSSPASAFYHRARAFQIHPIPAEHTALLSESCGELLQSRSVQRIENISANILSFAFFLSLNRCKSVLCELSCFKHHFQVHSMHQSTFMSHINPALKKKL